MFLVDEKKGLLFKPEREILELLREIAKKNRRSMAKQLEVLILQEVEKNESNRTN